MAFFPSGAAIIIGAADALSTTAGNFTATTYIKSFSQSGGEIDSELTKVFGGASIQGESEKGLVEVSMDFVAKEAMAIVFDQMIAGSSLDGSTAVSYADDPTDKVIYIQALGKDGSTYMTRAYNNVKPTSIEVSMDADGGMVEGTMTFKVAATDEAAATNVQVVKAAASTITW